MRQARKGAEIAWARHLHRKLRSVIASIPGHVDIRSEYAPRLHLTDDRAPNWVRIPVWLDQAWTGSGSSPRDTRVIGDVLWGQFALFLSIRLQDDLLDQQQADLRLLFAADRLLLESAGTLKRFGELDGDFWDFYSDCIRSTADGILRISRLEAEAGRFTTRHLALHARASAVLKVGAAAVSRIRGRRRDAAWLSRFQDQLAIFSQIEDDLQDLVPDLKAGRFTWVGNTLLAAEPGESIPLDALARRLGEALMRPERGAAIAATLRRVAGVAGAMVPASAPRQIHDLVLQLRATSYDLKRSLHEARVRWIFGQALDAASPPSRPTNSPSSTSNA